MPSPDLQIATLGGGCFWCLEAVFEIVKGVVKVESGYMGGRGDNPSYRDVCSGTTGHAEVVQVIFDPTLVTFATILDILFATHDPTTLNRQGHDVGTQYRSAIFCHSDEQLAIARSKIAEIEAAHIWDAPIVTEVVAASIFWKAEEYHQGYYQNHPGEGYCHAVVGPKVAKFRKQFSGLLQQS